MDRPVSDLVSTVLDTFILPYSRHVIDEVFRAIETSPEWSGSYETLVKEHDKRSYHWASG